MFLKVLFEIKMGTRLLTIGLKCNNVQIIMKELEMNSPIFHSFEFVNHQVNVNT